MADRIKRRGWAPESASVKSDGEPSTDRVQRNIKAAKSGYPDLPQKKIAYNRGGGVGGGGGSGKWHNTMHKDSNKMDPLKGAYTYGKKISTKDLGK